MSLYKTAYCYEWEKHLRQRFLWTLCSMQFSVEDSARCSSSRRKVSLDSFANCQKKVINLSMEDWGIPSLMTISSSPCENLLKKCCFTSSGSSHISSSQSLSIWKNQFSLKSNISKSSDYVKWFRTFNTFASSHPDKLFTAGKVLFSQASSSFWTGKIFVTGKLPKYLCLCNHQNKVSNVKMVYSQ